MGLSTASTFYLNNGVTVDSGSGVDIRLLDDAVSAIDDGQSIRWEQSQDGANRTFNPDTGFSNSDNNPYELQREGWALRLTEDVTPTDDTNCNASIPADIIRLTFYVRCNATGGTNLGGSANFSMRFSLWRYNPSTNAGSLVGISSVTMSWDTTAIGGENNTFKTASAQFTISKDVELLPGEVMMVQVGANATNLPDATLGTTNYDLYLRTGQADNTKLEFVNGEKISQICYTQGSSTGSSSASGSPAIVLPTEGVSAGVSTASATLEADKETTGVSEGLGVADGEFSAVKEATGSSVGVGDADGSLGLVIPTVGSVDIGEGGGDVTIVENYVFPIFD
jgi:hypothetical protein